MRAVAYALIVAMVVLVVASVLLLTGGVTLFSNASDFLQGIDAAVNEIILLGAASYFLIGWETRRKRRRALRALHVQLVRSQKLWLKIDILERVAPDK